jgi:hypothetical protein
LEFPIPSDSRNDARELASQEKMIGPKVFWKTDFWIRKLQFGFSKNPQNADLTFPISISQAGYTRMERKRPPKGEKVKNPDFGPPSIFPNQKFAFSQYPKSARLQKQKQS